tara:strand:- start:2034 stop:2531 length:498 start_codon:yes stop_codon:yes gene_type:complete
VALETLDKQQLLAALIDQLEQQVGGMARRARDVAASATHEESRPESDKDTRAIEESYLARGQARQAAEAEAALQMLRAVRLRHFDQDSDIALAALVLLQDEEGEGRTVFIAPAAGGSRVELQGHRIHVVTPASPLGRALIGKQLDEDVELLAGGRSRSWSIIELA